MNGLIGDAPIHQSTSLYPKSDETNVRTDMLVKGTAFRG